MKRHNTLSALLVRERIRYFSLPVYLTNTACGLLFAAVFVLLVVLMSDNGLFTAVLFPLSLVVLILTPIYFVETIFALILFQWIVMVITELLYLITNYKV